MPLPLYRNFNVNVNDCPPDLDALLDQAVQRGLPGYRNPTGFALVCMLRDSGLNQNYAVPLMMRYAHLVNRQPATHEYTAAEAMASLRSAYRHPRRLRTHPLYGPDGPAIRPAPPMCNPTQK